MNRINELFNNKKSEILSVFFTAGHPSLNDTKIIIKSLEKHGADMIELGIPFSDPMADGPVIQQSSQKALDNGMSLNLLFDQIKDIRKEVQLPLILMGYLNPVMQFGIEKFCELCKQTGIDGLILPDLPFELFINKYKNIFESHGLHNVFLITPQTTEARIRMIDENTNGFIYMVAASSTTGARQSILKDQEEYFNRINNMGLKNPRLIGFGISSKETFQKASQYSSGAIIGSAFIKALEEDGELDDKIEKFLNNIRG